MKASSGPTADGLLPVLTPGGAASPSIAPAPHDPTATFSEFLNQEGGAGAAAPNATATPWNSLPLSNTAAGVLAEPAAGSFVGPTLPSLSSPPFMDNATAAPSSALPMKPGMPSSTPTNWTPPAVSTAGGYSIAPSPGQKENVGSNASSFERQFSSTPSFASTGPLLLDSTAPANGPTHFSYFLDSSPAPATSAIGSPGTNVSMTNEANTTGPGTSSFTAGKAGSTPTASLTGLAWGVRIFSAAPTGTAAPAPRSRVTNDSTSGASAVAATPACSLTALTNGLAPASNPLPAAMANAGATSPLGAGIPTAVSGAATGATTAPTPILFGSPLATMMIHAAVAKAVARHNATAPVAGTSSPTTTTPTGNGEFAGAAAAIFSATPTIASLPNSVEKKSAVSAIERSFLQDKRPAGMVTDSTSLMFAATSLAAAQVVPSQQAMSLATTLEKPLAGLSPAAATSAGTTNGKKTIDMTTATLDLPAMTATGAPPSLTKAPTDVHIVLSTNNEFHEAIDQVMHVTDLSNLSRGGNPLRVAIEIHTPPGAIVNVYVSRQSDSSYRAQLSTNDAQALGWVQDQIASLKDATPTGAEIRWAPAQLDPATTPSTFSSGGDRDLSWSRGDSQGGYSQGENRPNRNPQQDDDSLEDESGGFRVPFLNTLGALGRVA